MSKRVSCLDYRKKFKSRSGLTRHKYTCKGGWLRRLLSLDKDGFNKKASLGGFGGSSQISNNDFGPIISKQLDWSEASIIVPRFDLNATLENFEIQASMLLITITIVHTFLV